MAILKNHLKINGHSYSYKFTMWDIMHYFDLLHFSILDLSHVHSQFFITKDLKSLSFA